MAPVPAPESAGGECRAEGEGLRPHPPDERGAAHFVALPQGPIPETARPDERPALVPCPPCLPRGGLGCVRAGAVRSVGDGYFVAGKDCVRLCARSEAGAAP